MKQLICIIGKSASGKTQIAEFVAKELGLNYLKSYTTRPKRKSNESGHTFISEETADTILNCSDVEILGYNEDFGGYQYFATMEQVSNIKPTVYVIEPKSFTSMVAKHPEIPTLGIYLHTEVYECLSRMKKDGLSEKAALERLARDGDSERLMPCDFIVFTTGRPLEYVAQEVQFVVREWLKAYEGEKPKSRIIMPGQAPMLELIN